MGDAARKLFDEALALPEDERELLAQDLLASPSRPAVTAAHRFHPGARVEVVEASAWYEERRPGYGARFLARVEEVLACVAAIPDGGRPWKTGPVRTWRVRGFPFLVGVCGEWRGDAGARRAAREARAGVLESRVG